MPNDKHDIENDWKNEHVQDFNNHQSSHVGRLPMGLLGQLLALDGIKDEVWGDIEGEDYMQRGRSVEDHGAQPRQVVKTQSLNAK